MENNLSTMTIAELLRQQLELLAEKSKSADEVQELVDLADAMIRVIHVNQLMENYTPSSLLKNRTAD